MKNRRCLLSHRPKD